MTKPLLIIQPATSYDDLPALCATRGDEVNWICDKLSLHPQQLRTVKVYQGQALPDPEEVRAAIITGAIDMVTDGHDWIEATAEWVRRAIAVNTPVLGVCFGHQLIAHALGGTVGENPRGAKFGKVTISKTPLEGSDPIFEILPETMEMKVFHLQSVLALPANAEVLAHSDHDPYQAVRYADSVWGVQFHPEFDSEIMDKSYDVYHNMITEAGFSVPELRAQDFDDKYGKALLRGFLDYAEQSGGR